ncbi:uncharacterized protein RBU33_002633 isoform 1-T2 [Hipposideros larvatus]
MKLQEELQQACSEKSTTSDFRKESKQRSEPQPLGPMPQSKHSVWPRDVFLPNGMRKQWGCASFKTRPGIYMFPRARLQVGCHKYRWLGALPSELSLNSDRRSVSL